MNFISTGKQPPKTWPHLGKIIFDKMFLRYQENEPPVLKNICCVIEPKQKVCDSFFLMKRCCSFAYFFFLDWNRWTNRSRQIILDYISF